jgi:hypothetical protein
VRRAVCELEDHQNDLFDEAIAAGLTPAEAVLDAEQRIGTPELIADSYVRQFKTSSESRGPLRVASMACILEWADDVAAEQPQCMVRWCVALTTAGLGTGVFLLGLHAVLFG